MRLPQQRFLFFFNYSYSVNYLKVRDTISVIIFICTIYLVFFCFILLRFREVFLRFVITRTIILTLPLILALRLATNRFMARYRERFLFETRCSQINQEFLVYTSDYTQWSVPACFNLQQITIDCCVISNSLFTLIRGYSICSNKKSTTIKLCQRRIWVECDYRGYKSDLFSAKHSKQSFWSPSPLLSLSLARTLSIS